jgi:hypothetical protein
VSGADSPAIKTPGEWSEDDAALMIPTQREKFGERRIERRILRQGEEEEKGQKEQARA